MQQLKTCSKCGNEKPIDDFWKDKSKPDGHHPRCKLCARAAVYEWREKPDNRARINKDNYVAMWKRRGCKFSLEQAQVLIDSQNGKCAICKDPIRLATKDRNAFHIDHDHTTKEIRGALCGHCNRGLGHFHDRPDLLRKAADYLTQFK